MLQVFDMDVAKVDPDVAYVAMAIYVYYKHIVGDLIPGYPRRWNQ